MIEKYVFISNYMYEKQIKQQIMPRFIADLLNLCCRWLYVYSHYLVHRKTKQKKIVSVRTFDPLVNDDDVCRNYLAVEQNTVGKKVFCLFKAHFYTQCSRQNVFSYVLVLHPLNELVLSGKSWVRPEVCHTTYSWNIKWQKCAHMGLNGFVLKKQIKIKTLKRKKIPGSRLEVAC